MLIEILCGQLNTHIEIEVVKHWGLVKNNISWCTTVWLENLQPPIPFREVLTNVKSSS